MGKVIAQFTMSLDGFIAGPGDEVGRLFKWYGAGETDFPVAGTEMVFKVSAASSGLLEEEWATLGAIVTGRRDFEVSKAWGGQPILGLPHFIVSHSVPEEWAGAGSPFRFVTEGVERGIELAQEAAGEKVVGVGGSTITRQCLRAGLLDELYIDLAPMLLGEGIGLFDEGGWEGVELEILRVVDTPAVTHVRYRVVR